MMNITHQKERKRIIPFVKQFGKVIAINGNQIDEKNMTNNEQKRLAKLVVNRIMARIKRI